MRAVSIIYYNERPKQRIYDFLIGLLAPLLVLFFIYCVNHYYEYHYVGNVDFSLFNINPDGINATSVVLSSIFFLYILLFTKRSYMKLGFLSFLMSVGYLYMAATISEMSNYRNPNAFILFDLHCTVTTILVSILASMATAYGIYRKTRNSEIITKDTPVANGKKDILWGFVFGSLFNLPGVVVAAWSMGFMPLVMIASVIIEIIYVFVLFTSGRYEKARGILLSILSLPLWIMFCLWVMSLIY